MPVNMFLICSYYKPVSGSFWQMRWPTGLDQMGGQLHQRLYVDEILWSAYEDAFISSAYGELS